MKTYAKLIAISLAGGLAGMPSFAAPNDAANTQSGVSPDNSRVNAQDQNNIANSADQAQNTKSDVDIMAQIRRSIVQDKSLSTYAHNVKVVAQNGFVTLSGPVNTADEKTKIEQIAAGVVGEGQVVNKLTVKGS